MGTRLMKKKLYPKYWKTDVGEKISCKEKIIILNSNIDELQNLISEIYDEALLMGVSKNQIKKIINEVAINLHTELKND